MARPRCNSSTQARRRGAAKRPVKKEEEEEESAWEQSDEDQDDDEEEFEADEEDEDDEDDASEATPPPKKRAPRKPVAKKKADPTATTEKKPAPPRKKKRRRVNYDTDTSDEGHLMPTELRKTTKGGYAHTKLSRARISKANRGNTPWNKGRQRSEADKAKIAAAVRARNAAILKEKLKKFNMTEEEFRAKQKEIKYLRERVRRAKVAAKKKKEQLDGTALSLEVELNKAIATRDEIVNTKTGVIKKSDIAAAKKADAAKRKAEAEEAKIKAEEALTEEAEPSKETKAPAPSEEESANDAEVSPEKSNAETPTTPSEEKAKKKVTLIVKTPNLSRFPIVAWNMEWTPHDLDSEPQVCPDGGPSGLACCETCAYAYSRFMTRTVQDMEGRRMEAVANNVEELLGYIEETRMQLMVTAQAARQKPPPPTPYGEKRLAEKRAENSNQDELMGWSMTSTLDMSNFDDTTLRI